MDTYIPTNIEPGSYTLSVYQIATVVDLDKKKCPAFDKIPHGTLKFQVTVK
jgi:hypothetical protein